MSWSKIMGQPVAVRQLQNAIKRNRVGHAYLFYGPAGVGKRTTARIFAQSLLCLDPSAGNRCGHCRACELYPLEHHPDIQEIVPQGTAMRIQIQQIRELSREALFQPLISRYKLFLLPEAERMTLEAANNLLKILEEPPVHVIFILTTAANLRLLPTLLSRCQQIQFSPLTALSIETYLREEERIDPSLARQLAYMGGGSLGEAMALQQQLQTGKLLRETVLEILTQLKKNNLLGLYPFKFGRERSQVKLMLQILGLWFRDVMIWQKTAEKKLLVNRDQFTLIQQHALIWKQAEQILRRIEDAYQKLERNANIPLLLEVLLLELFEYRGGLGRGSRGRGPF